MKNHSLLVEKYRPTNLDNYVGNKSIKKSISNYINQNDIQSDNISGIGLISVYDCKQIINRFQ